MMSHSLTPCLAATDYQSVAMQNPDQGRVIDNDSGAEIMLNCCLKLITEHNRHSYHTSVLLETCARIIIYQIVCFGSYSK